MDVFMRLQHRCNIRPYEIMGQGVIEVTIFTATVLQQALQIVSYDPRGRMFTPVFHLIHTDKGNR
jgi:hypothetical protein